MDKKLFRSCILLILAGILAFAAIFNLKTIASFFSSFMAILTPLFIGIGIVLILNRPYMFFTRQFEKTVKNDKYKKFIKPVCIIIVYVLFIAVIGLIISFVIPELSQNVSKFVLNFDSYVKTFSAWMIEILNKLNLPEFDMSSLTDLFKNVGPKIAGAITSVFPHIFNFTSGLASTAVNICFGIVLSLYMLIDKQRLISQLSRVIDRYIPEKTAKRIYKISRMSSQTFQNFVVGQIFEAGIFGVICFLGMVIFRFDYPLLISVIIALSCLVPIVGIFIGTALSAFLILMVDPIKSLWFIIFIIIAQQLESNLIYPKVVGTSIGLPAFWLIVVIIVASGLWGIPGILLGVPAASVIYQLLKNDTKKDRIDTKKIASSIYKEE